MRMKDLKPGELLMFMYGGSRHPRTWKYDLANDTFLFFDETGAQVNWCDEGANIPFCYQLAEVKPGDWLQSLTSEERKEVAVARGLFAYFPDALALIARHSVRANEKHNPGEPVHWSREKSSDHEDCIARHSLAVAVNPDSMDGDAPHIVCRAWRALAALQLWAENQK